MRVSLEYEIQVALNFSFRIPVLNWEQYKKYSNFDFRK